MPGVLLIAAGTPYETLVRDCRDLFRWSSPVTDAYKGTGRLIVYHHTAGQVPPQRSTYAQLQFLMQEARGGEWGLPYNFVVMPNEPHRVYYLNDVDQCWPHTYGHNCATAICAVGNFSRLIPPPKMVAKMIRLADALASMWGQHVPEVQHRDVYATECPGNFLSALLPASLRPRD